MEGIETRYTPDVRVDFIDGATGWFEVKPSIRLLNHKIKKKTEAIKIHFSDTERDFFIATEELILASPMVENLLLLMYHRRGSDVSEEYDEELKLKFHLHHPKILNDAITMLGAQEAWRLLGLGYIGVDLRAPLSVFTPIFLSGGHRHANIYA
jgi:hypothetical protein